MTWPFAKASTQSKLLLWPASNTGKDTDHCEDQDVASRRPRGLGYSSSFFHLRPVGGQILVRENGKPKLAQKIRNCISEALF